MQHSQDLGANLICKSSSSLLNFTLFDFEVQQVKYFIVVSAHSQFNYRAEQLPIRRFVSGEHNS